MGNATLRAVFGAVAVVLTLSLCAEGGGGRNRPQDYSCRSVVN